MLFGGFPALGEADDVIRLMEEEAAAVAVSWGFSMSKIVRETLVLQATGTVKLVWYAR